MVGRDPAAPHGDGRVRARHGYLGQHRRSRRPPPRPAMKLSVGVEIAAPPDDVWRVLEPIEHHVEWMSDAESITFTGPTTRGVGTTFDCVTKIGPLRLTDRMAVTDWEPGHAMGITHEGAVKGTRQVHARRRPSRPYANSHGRRNCAFRGGSRARPAPRSPHRSCAPCGVVTCAHSRRSWKGPQHESGQHRRVANTRHRSFARRGARSRCARLFGSMGRGGERGREHVVARRHQPGHDRARPRYGCRCLAVAHASAARDGRRHIATARGRSRRVPRSRDLLPRRRGPVARRRIHRPPDRPGARVLDVGARVSRRETRSRSRATSIRSSDSGSACASATASPRSRSRR